MNAIVEVKKLFDREDIKERMMRMLGDSSANFVTSVINVAGQSAQLSKAEPDSIIRSAMIAASLKLPIDPNLGFAAIVPYKNGRNEVYLAQFQIMWRGLVQLAIRTGQYATINAVEVYEDELVNYNPFTSEVKFKQGEMRNREDGKIVGYYAYFRLLNGFAKEMYMTSAEVEKHAMKYSSAYKYDKSANKKSSKWSTDFDAMGRKTVLKLLLSRYGILSIDMEKAMKYDQAFTSGDIDDPEVKYLDNPDFEDKTIVTNPFDSKMEVEDAKDVVEIDDDLKGTPFDPDFQAEG